MNTDHDFIDAAITGDTAAFGQLVLKYQDRLFNTLAHVIGCASEAEDVAQEAFVQAFINLKSFQRKSSVYTWLYRIALNNWISRTRRTKKQQSIQHAMEVAGEEPVSANSAPDQPLERRERVELVQQAIAQLEDEQRMVIVLREIEGCDYEQIAEILEIPLGTVRSRLHRARLQLKEKLKGVFQENI
ncbi:MAG: sigma-70 family RNA polymerase sigma factor [Pirellulaceae bacterium]|nr:sigma-70 family RNA polymerase sigma factor [Planctomycetales bacterium]